MSPVPGMSLTEAVRLVHQARRPDDVVISAMGASREWMALGAGPLDWVFVPSSMGQATSLGLGLALARPDRRIIVLSGDGGTLMNLGSLVTITAYAPANLIILVFDNSAYEITGAQPTPGSAAARSDRQRIDFAALARASGFRSVYHFATIENWSNGMQQVLRAAGPSLAVLDVAPIPGAVGPRSPGPAPVRARAFMAALAGVRGGP